MDAEKTVTHKGAARVVIVDEDEAWRLDEEWSIAETRPGYYSVVKTGRIAGKRWTRILAREILGARRGEVVDHLDRDPLNNRRSNLIKTTTAGNNRNRGPNRSNPTGLRGVSVRYDVNGRARYRARAIVDGETHYFRTFDSEMRAALIVERFWKQRAETGSEDE